MSNSLDSFFWEETLRRLNLESPGRAEAVKLAKIRSEEKKKFKR